MQVLVIDVLGKSPARDPYARMMRANNTSVMAQSIAVWCEELGHDTHIAYYSGDELMAGSEPDRPAVVFISAFSQCAYLAYALSARYRASGAITVLGGPHARSYPLDAIKYFDYVIGQCDRRLIDTLLSNCAPRPRGGQWLAAAAQPATLPGLRARWKFLAPAIACSPLLKIVPIIGSLGCPYTCSFCIDAEVPYQPLDFDSLRDDLRFFQSLRLRGAVVVWHDPNFGIRFDDYMRVIEDTVPPGAVTFLIETSLSILNTERLERLRRNGCRFVAPGVESWHEMGNKARTARVTGLDKVRMVAEQCREVNAYIPYMQANLVFGFDSDEGDAPFELTRRFVDLAPGVYPHFAILTAFGRNAPGNAGYLRDGRLLPVPFEFLDLIEAMNVRPKHYAWDDFYTRLCSVYEHAFAPSAIARRAWHNRRSPIAIEQVFRAIASDHWNRLRYHRRMQRWLRTDRQVRAFFEGETTRVPDVMAAQVTRHLGRLAAWLPDGALVHDPDQFAAPVAERATA